MNLAPTTPNNTAPRKCKQEQASSHEQPLKTERTVHLSYCTNIHRGETWAQLFPELKKNLPKVKAISSPSNAMGVGLRLSSTAANDLYTNPKQLNEFKQWLIEHDLYVYTVNGFPYGDFHSNTQRETKKHDTFSIKEKVYEPDWTTPARLRYTKQLAEILAVLLPEGVQGSISTVPVGYKENINSVETLTQAINHLFDFTAFAVELEQRSNKTIRLALEPEPSCFLETKADVINFFSQHLFSAAILNDYLRENTDLNLQDSSALTLDNIKQHLGVCLDTCHSTVMFEDPRDFADAMEKHDIAIVKIQLTTALKIEHWQDHYFDMVSPYAEPVYLHQSCIKNTKSGEVRFHLDLSEALHDIKPGEELRSHFHVPVFADELNSISTTQSELLLFLQHYCDRKYCDHLEVETYTFNVLPEDLVLGSVSESIGRELSWAIEKLR